MMESSGFFKKPLEALREPGAAVHGLALPDDQDLPPHGPEPCQIIGIALDIARELASPVAEIGLRRASILAGLLGMLVPEAPVHENHLAPGPEYKIGLAGKIMGMKAVSKPHPMYERPHDHFRLHVLIADTRHIGASSRGT